MNKTSFKELDSVDEEIINEFNREVKDIEDEMMEISEIMTELSCLIHDQGEEIQISVAHTEHAKEEVVQTVDSLERSKIYNQKRKEIISYQWNISRCIGILRRFRRWPYHYH